MVTLSGDEALVYPAVAASGFGLLHFWARTAAEELAARRLLRVFGDFGAVCLVEAFFKIMVYGPFISHKPPTKEPSLRLVWL